MVWKILLVLVLTDRFCIGIWISELKHEFDKEHSDKRFQHLI